MPPCPTQKGSVINSFFLSHLERQGRYSLRDQSFWLSQRYDVSLKCLPIDSSVEILGPWLLMLFGDLSHGEVPQEKGGHWEPLKVVCVTSLSGLVLPLSDTIGCE